MRNSTPTTENQHSLFWEKIVSVIFAVASCPLANAAFGYEHAGKVVSWSWNPGGIELRCGDRQVAKIDILGEGLFRVRFSADGAFPRSEMIEDWGLVKPNDAYPATAFEVREEEKHLLITTKQLRIELVKNPLRIRVCDKNGRLLTRESDAPGMGAGKGAYLQMEKAADEHFFGLGKGVGAIHKNVGFGALEILGVPLHGTQLNEGVTTLDQTGKKIFCCLGPQWSGFVMNPTVIPFFMSTKGYGIYLNNFRDSIFDLGNASSDFWSITLGGPPNHVPNANVLDFYFIHGPSFKTILDRYTDLTGRTPMVPKWSLGYFQICDFQETQAGVLRMAQHFRQQDFPCDTLLLEPGWMKTPYRMDGWSPKNFPDPNAMIAELKKQHFKLGLWQCGPADWVFTSWDKLARKTNQWGADIMNPSDVEKYVGFHTPYYDQGIAFFKQDGCGQAEWQPNEPYHNGLTGKEMHNIIPTLYSKIMYEGFKKHTGRRAMNFTPHTGPSGQRYPGVWPSGDGGGGHDQFIGEMNMGLSGHSYTSHDFGDRSPSGIHWSLLGPWCPGALSGVPQGSMCQFYLKMRYRLIPYIYTSHRQAALTGIPYMRAMVLEYQDDPATYTLDRQCMLGDWLLMAAYTNDVYLPAGTWFDYWSGEPFHSKGEWKRGCQFPETAGGPLFVKGGAIIPMGPVTAWVDKEPLDIVTLDIYPHGESAYALYEDDGATYEYEKGACAATEFRCRSDKNKIQITLGDRQGSYGGMPKNRSYLLGIHCQGEPSAVLKSTAPLPRQQTKEALVADAAAKGWYYDPQTHIVWIKPMEGWNYGADERGKDDPEKDTVYWTLPGNHQEKGYDVTVLFPEKEKP